MVLFICWSLCDRDDTIVPISLTQRHYRLYNFTHCDLMKFVYKIINMYQIFFIHSVHWFVYKLYIVYYLYKI